LKDKVKEYLFEFHTISTDCDGQVLCNGHLQIDVFLFEVMLSDFDNLLD
jgi:hypothetical protein